MPLSAARAWSWLFAPVDARVTGWMRLSLGAVLLVAHAAYGLELQELFSDDAALTRGMYRTDRAWIAWHRLVSADALPLLHGALALPAVAVVLGVGGRAPLVAALLVQIALMHGNGLAQNGGDRLLRMWTLCLLGSPCTHTVSVDAWWARRRGRPLPGRVQGLAVRLVQVQLAWMYFTTGLAKLGGGVWRGGDALYYALLAEHFQRFGGLLQPEVLGRGLPYRLTQAGTWGTLVFEAGFPALVAWRRTRWATLAAGVVLHLGIFATMMVGMFSVASLWGYLAFVLPALPAFRAAPSGDRDQPEQQSAG